MFCRYCNTEKDISEFPTIDKFLLDGSPYRMKRCNICHKEYVDKKERNKILKQLSNKKKIKKVKLPTKNNNFIGAVLICSKCGKSFTKDYVQTSGRPIKNCPKCRKIHSIGQDNSQKKLHHERVEKAGISIIKETTSLAKTITKEEIIMAIAKEIANKMYKK